MPDTNIDAGTVARRLEEFDSKLSARLKLGKAGLLRRLLALTVRERLKLQENLSRRASIRASIKSIRKRERGEIVRIGYSFIRPGYYIALGAGKGRKADSAAAKAAANDWLTPELDLMLDDIADLVAEGYADLVTASFKINIPGLYFRQTS